ncbi:MAG: C10 family peptidase [Marinifilum sp.]|jgi:hypothetical protein|nr:C10 family peptidase [Marinifilum sp.]
MKKLYYLLASMAVILMLARCETINMDDEMDAINPDKNEINKGINYNVSLKSAKYLIQSTEKDKTIKNIEPLVTGKDTLMFIFNFDNGWQVVSGDKRTEPILASDKDGKLSIEKLSNPGVATWLSDKADKILYLKKNNPKIDYNENIELWVLIDKAAHFTKENLEKYNTKYSAISSEKTKQVKKRPLPDGSYRWIKRLVSVTSTPWNVSSQKGPLLKTKWGQGNPWNTDVPYALINDNKWIKCPTGCTAVAMAQFIICIIELTNLKGCSIQLAVPVKYGIVRIIE